MEEHSAIGERILANVEDYSEIAIIVRHITNAGMEAVTRTGSQASRFL